MSVLFLGIGFTFSFLVTNERVRPGTPALDDLGIPAAYLARRDARIAGGARTG